MGALISPPKPRVAAPLIASPDNAEAMAEADREERLRRRRAGAGATVLTSPLGIPASPTLG